MEEVIVDMKKEDLFPWPPMRFLSEDVEHLKQVFPFIMCPFCPWPLFALPASLVAKYGTDDRGHVLFDCPICRGPIDYNPESGLALAGGPEPERPDWEPAQGWLVDYREIYGWKP